VLLPFLFHFIYQRTLWLIHSGSLAFR
jgi:hypothetical protein